MGAITLYTGPSALDGAPIVVLCTLGSTNEKTGPMVQTFILRADMTPVQASQAKADASVCGQCPRRHSLGGDCYVLIHNAPQSSWRAWDRAGRPDGDIPSAIRACQRDATKHGVRLGAYGDPAAVPHHVWEQFLAGLGSPRHTGYSHQWSRGWRLAGMPHTQALAHRDWCRANLMASVDTIEEAEQARALGWRYFLAVPESAIPSIPERTVECLSVRDGSMETCRTCGICDGASRGASKASVYLVEHGARSSSKARRLASLQVIR